jgi:hypothetical protein
MAEIESHLLGKIFGLSLLHNRKGWYILLINIWKRAGQDDTIYSGVDEYVCN